MNCLFPIVVLKILLYGIRLQIFNKNGGGFRNLSFVWDGSENEIMVFNNENNDLNPLAAYYFSFMVHL